MANVENMVKATKKLVKNHGNGQQKTSGNVKVYKMVKNAKKHFTTLAN